MEITQYVCVTELKARHFDWLAKVWYETNKKSDHCDTKEASSIIWKQDWEKSLLCNIFFFIYVSAMQKIGRLSLSRLNICQSSHFTLGLPQLHFFFTKKKEYFFLISFFFSWNCFFRSWNDSTNLLLEWDALLPHWEGWVQGKGVMLKRSTVCGDVKNPIVMLTGNRLWWCY